MKLDVMSYAYLSRLTWRAVKAAIASQDLSRRNQPLSQKGIETSLVVQLLRKHT